MYYMQREKRVGIVTSPFPDSRSLDIGRIQVLPLASLLRWV